MNKINTLICLILVTGVIAVSPQSEGLSAQNDDYVIPGKARPLEELLKSKTNEGRPPASASADGYSERHIGSLSLSLPLEWQKDNDQSNAVTTMFTTDNFSLQIFHRTGFHPYRELADDLVPISLAGRSATRYEISYKLSKDVVLELDDMNSQGERLSFTFTAAQKNWPAFQPVFDRIVSSIRFGDVAGEKTGEAVDVVNRPAAETTRSPAEKFLMIANAGIPGYNRQILNGASVAECARACLEKSWCKSFDFERSAETCYLQPVDQNDEKLKHDYSGHPYDHYMLKPKSASRTDDEGQFLEKPGRVKPLPTAAPTDARHDAEQISACENGTVTITNPQVGKHFLDYCRSWASSCGMPAAQAFCKLKGHGKAVDFVLRKDSPVTMTINDRIACRDPGCDRITKVVCKSTTCNTTSGGLQSAENWQSYSNPRFGTSIDYPASLFEALPPPENGDGRKFNSLDGRSGFLIFGSHNALEQSVKELFGEQLVSDNYEAILGRKLRKDGFSLWARGKGKDVIQKIIFDGSGIIHTFKMTFLQADHAALEPVMERMLASFSATPKPSGAPLGSSPTVPEATGASNSDTGKSGNQAVELAFWQTISQSSDPADFEAYLAMWPNGSFASLANNKLRRLRQAAPANAAPAPDNSTPPVSTKRYYTPMRGTRERKNILDAARIPASRDIGQNISFVVSIVRSDGEWAYVQATPHHPNGGKLDWSQTQFASDWKNDVMSDVVMVLLRNNGGRWEAIDHVIGPTDVHWIGWLKQYNLPEALFSAR